MANWTALKAAIAAVIKTNGNKEITGAVLQSTLNTIVSNLGENATFNGVATPATIPGTPDGNIFYLSSIAGTYTNFANYVVSNKLVVFTNNSGAWVGTELNIPTNDEFLTAKTNIAANKNQLDAISTIGKNLFNKDAIITGYYIWTTGGTLSVEPNSAVSPLIPVTGGAMYYLSGRNCGNNNVRFLDANGNLLKPLNADTGVALSTYSLPYQNGKILAPANAINIQFTIKLVNVGTFEAIQFELGSVQTTFESYGYKIKTAGLVGIATTEQVNAVSLVANDAKTNIDLIRDGLSIRLNTNENTANPAAFPAVTEETNHFGITITADTESPVKDYIGYKRVFLNTLMNDGATCYRTWTIPLLNQLRPTKICVAYWTKKTEFAAIFGTQYQSYLGLCVFVIASPMNAINNNVPIIVNGDASPELNAAKLKFEKIYESGDYIRLLFTYYDLDWKTTFTASEIYYYFLFNGATSKNKPLTIIDFTTIINADILGKNVYPDSGTLTGEQTLKGAYDIIASGQTKINNLSLQFNNQMKVKKVGNLLYIVSPWSSQHDLVKVVEYIRTSSFTNNPNCNFNGEHLCLKNADPTVVAISLKGSDDDICPAYLNGSYIGGNHSWVQGYNVQMTSHGKTIADVGSVYKNSSNIEFVILRIVDANNIWIISKNQGSDGVYTFVAPSGTLTYVSNGANTANISISTATGLGNTYTAITPATIKALVNGVNEIISDGTTECNYFDLIENYDALDLPSIITQIIANRPSGGYTTQPLLNELTGTEKLFNHSIVYRFTPNGNTIVTTTILAYKKLTMNFHGFIQAGALSSGNIYCPKSLPISDGATTYDLRKISNWTTPPVTALNLIPTYWENPLSPPDRVINMNANVNLMLGYITDRGIESSRKDVVANSMFLNTSLKLYPMGISVPTVVEANNYYSAVAFRTYTNPANNPTGRTNYAFVEVGNDIFLFCDYHGALIDSLPIMPNWVGKKITVYEKNTKCNVLSNVVSGSIKIQSIADANNYGFIVLKLS